ncbi:MAG TPA: NADH-quinone oxidoreductase subunit L, partial [Terriglobales bacterium]|nr:NADH-quinone oxidoreductase subunit L [Terriglobales bacterium]
ESPRVMIIPLAILAVLSVIGGWIGVPGSLGGSNRFDKFLAPVFHTTIPQSEAQGMPPEERTEGAEPAAGRSQELTYTGISVLAAALGLYLAWLLYHHRPHLPDQIAAALGRIYLAVANKYYVDELYGILFVKPLIDGSRRILWQGIDQNVIDGAVNDSADNARHISDSIRHMQSGNLRSYAGWVAVGAAAVIAYMVWLGVR